MKRKAFYFLTAIAVIIFLFFIFQFISTQWQKWQKEADANTESLAIPVTVATVVQHEFQREINAVSTLEARETSLLSPKVAGHVDAVLVDIGTRVDAYQVVIRLDRTNFDLAVAQANAAHSAAEAAILQASAQLEHAEKQYYRTSDLLSEKVIPQSRFETAEAAYKSAREALASAREQRNQAKAILDSALEHRRNADIRSPIAGIVVERNVEVGQAVAPGALLFRIVNQTFVKADAAFPETDLGCVSRGANATIVVDAFPEQEFPGIVTVINPMVDRKTRTFHVRIEAPNPKGKLVDGMFARVRLLVNNRVALAVPRDSLQRLPGSGTSYVFVVEGNKALKRIVKIGTADDHFTEVRNGLAEDEKVVISGAGRLRSGIEVQIEAISKENK